MLTAGTFKFCWVRGFSFGRSVVASGLVADRCSYSKSVSDAGTIHRCFHAQLGAHVDEFSAAGLWSADVVGTHVNMLELAVHLALEEFRVFLSSKSLLFCSDNISVGLI